MKRALLVSLLLVLWASPSFAGDPNCNLDLLTLGGQPYRTIEDIPGTIEVTLCAVRMRGSGLFAVRYLCDSAAGTPNVNVRVEASSGLAPNGYAPTGLNFSITDEVPHVAQLNAIAGYGRVVLSGNPGNPNDTKCAASVEPAVSVAPTPQPTFSYIPPTPQSIPATVATPTAIVIPTAVPTAWPTPPVIPTQVPTPIVPTPVPTHTHAPTPTPSTLTGQASMNMGATASNACITGPSTIPVTGAVVGQAVVVGAPATAIGAGVFYEGNVSAAGQVTIRACKFGTTSFTPPNGTTYTARVIP